ncbi:MarR family winged helix-turn-helix transcriptional regulator [Microbacterium sp. nov. GSS16]|uniref:MarR family winged helix-turn-helix transcriptional regulator n=1 Tax=Microbacterium sp. nov. GSS16 TaxID=3019890 RepID=UPI00230500BC|nr:MarR family transcriptional regulator [Microbacterium sp. nov. GSS16]MEE2814827.1 MarR family transcriptional regulator [Actinomycetota bacterium]WCD91639.1 MarR family transcriptional regulator [Microbacterium sp. nov. GSS16]
MTTRREGATSRGRAMMDPRVIDPGEQLVSFKGMGDADIDQVVRVLAALRAWRETEQRISWQSRTEMKLNETDMEALRFLVASLNNGVVVTAGMLADHLRISTSSTTKMLDRLARAGHISRTPHPTDRRAVMVSITPHTHEQVRDSIGRVHADRFTAVAELAPAERDVVARFLERLARGEESSR